MHANHPIRHLNRGGGESWLGLIDGVYSIAMTLIAIELPELIKSLFEISSAATSRSSIIAITSYEFIAYTATFLLLYELWSYHKSILRLAGIRHQIQSLINSIILAITCLGAGNIILILNTKTTVALEDLRLKTNQKQLFQDWVGTHHELAIATFVMIAAMFFLMGLLARWSRKDQTPGSDHAIALRSLELGTRWRAVCYLVFLLTWTPLLIGHTLPLVPPAVLVLGYILANQILYPLIEHRRRL
ncbi:TMEM175 family protein [Parasynechococcus sp.]|jgi:uncharacterized membrane protein|uniref:TMEM175 family protein n=1 Tax=Parasynechococcus sp. TaxID=3101203 RepID=UPI0037045197